MGGAGSSPSWAWEARIAPNAAARAMRLAGLDAPRTSALANGRSTGQSPPPRRKPAAAAIPSTANGFSRMRRSSSSCSSNRAAPSTSCSRRACTVFRISAGSIASSSPEMPSLLLAMAAPSDSRGDPPDEEAQPGRATDGENRPLARDGADDPVRLVGLLAQSLETLRQARLQLLGLGAKLLRPVLDPAASVRRHARLPG